MGWYDNEWGFSNRMADTAALFGGSEPGRAVPFRTLDNVESRGGACCSAPTSMFRSAMAGSPT